MLRSPPRRLSTRGPWVFRCPTCAPPFPARTSLRLTSANDILGPQNERCQGVLDGLHDRGTSYENGRFVSEVGLLTRRSWVRSPHGPHRIKHLQDSQKAKTVRCSPGAPESPAFPLCLPCPRGAPGVSPSAPRADVVSAGRGTDAPGCPRTGDRLSGGVRVRRPRNRAAAGTGPLLLAVSSRRAAAGGSIRSLNAHLEPRR
jgi:hypothetical protein